MNSPKATRPGLPRLAYPGCLAHGDLAAFRTIQRQPAWRGKDETAR